MKKNYSLLETKSQKKSSENKKFSFSSLFDKKEKPVKTPEEKEAARKKADQILRTTLENMGMPLPKEKPGDKKPTIDKSVSKNNLGIKK